MRKPQRQHDHRRLPDIVASRLAGAMSGPGQPLTASQRALYLMQQIYELDAALSRKRQTALSVQDICDEWHAHSALIRQAHRRHARAWALELLRIVAVRHGIEGRVFDIPSAPLAMPGRPSPAGNDDHGGETFA